jgi:hypothetical protein
MPHCPLRLLALFALVLASSQLHAEEPSASLEFLSNSQDNAQIGKQPIVPHWYSNTNDDIENLPIVGDGQAYIPQSRAMLHKTLGLLPLCYSEAKRKKVPCGVTLPERPRRDMTPQEQQPVSGQQST